MYKTKKKNASELFLVEIQSLKMCFGQILADLHVHICCSIIYVVTPKKSTKLGTQAVFQFFDFLLLFLSV